MNNVKLFFVNLFFLMSAILTGCSCNGPNFYLPQVEEFSIGEYSSISEYDPEILFEGILIGESVDSLHQGRDKHLIYEVTDVFIGSCIDTITVKTPTYSSACGYRDDIGSYSIISAKRNKYGEYFIYNSYCSLNVSQKYQKNKFQKFRSYLISTKYKLNGNYKFEANQFESVSCRYTKLHLKYTIKAKKYNGVFSIVDSNDRIIEHGYYANGIKIGKWKYRYGRLEVEDEHKVKFLDSLIVIDYSVGKKKIELSEYYFCD